MKLIRMSIENFGKLQNQDFTFQDGCNVFCHENGWGKSTIAAFLKVMLYGFDNERSRDGYSNERKRYRPWQGGVYGGSLTFETAGKVYTAVRTFGLKEKEDTFVLREESTNLESRDYSARLGEELFHIDRASFEKTVFLSQNDCETKATDQIHAKLGNLTETMDDINQYEKADARLNDLLNGMSPVRKTGSLYRLKEQIGESEAEVRAGEHLDTQMRELLTRRSELREEYANLQTIRKNLTEMQRTASIYKDLQAKKEKYKVLCEHYQRKNREAEKQRRSFAGVVPEATELDNKISQCIALAAEENTVNIYRLSELEQQNLEKWEALFEEEPMEETDRFNKKDRTEEQHTGNNKSRNLLYPAMIVCGIMVAAAGVALLYQKMFAGIVVLAAGIVLAITGLIRRQKEQISREYESIMLENQRNEMKNSFSAYEKLKEKKHLYEEACSAYEEMKDNLENYLRSLGQVPEPTLQRQLLELKYRMEKYEMTRQEAISAREEMTLFEETEDMEQICGTEVPEEQSSMEDTEKRIRRIQEQMENCQRMILQNESQIQECMKKSEELSEKEELVSTLKEQYYKDTVKYERLRMTREYLSRAKSSFTAKYRNPLMKAFSRYYQMMSGEAADSCYLDADMNLTVQELGGQREAKYFSAGRKDLLGICMRMSFVDAMYQEEKPFLIFDDPFVNLDSEKTEDGLAFIKKISEKYQILYFTCHESRNFK